MYRLKMEMPCAEFAIAGTCVTLCGLVVFSLQGQTRAFPKGSPLTSRLGRWSRNHDNPNTRESCDPHLQPSSNYKKNVMISSSSEETFYGVGEWAEFFGVFFNKESAVTNLADERRQRWLDQSAQVYPQNPKPKVLLLDAWYKEGNSWGQSTGWYLQVSFSVLSSKSLGRERL